MKGRKVHLSHFTRKGPTQPPPESQPRPETAMSSPSALIINANPLLNLLHHGPIQVGTINRVPSLEAHAEGKGVNVARVLTRLGQKVLVTGFAGGRSGAWLKEVVLREGLEEHFVETEAPLRMGFMAASEHSGPPTSVLAEGFPLTLHESEMLMKVVERSLASGVRLVIISGSVPDPRFAHLYPAILEAAAQKNIPCWLDAHGEGLVQALQSKHPPALAKPNREEFLESRDWGHIPEVHVTDGDKPVEVLIEGRPTYRIEPPFLTEINPIGCGDCYLAGLAMGFLEGWEAERRYRFASACGAANARRHDVAQISQGEVDAILDRVTLSFLR